MQALRSAGDQQKDWIALLNLYGQEQQIMKTQNDSYVEKTGDKPPDRHNNLHGKIGGKMTTTKARRCEGKQARRR